MSTTPTRDEGARIESILFDFWERTGGHEPSFADEAVPTKAQILQLIEEARIEGQARLAKSILLGDGELTESQKARLQAIVDKRLAQLKGKANQ